MRTAALLLTLSAGLVLAAENKDEKGDLDKVQGTWSRASAEVDGKKATDAELKDVRLTIKGDQYTLKMGDQTRTGTIKLDGSKKPKTLDIIAAEGPNKGKTLPGIYELDGDTFRYCIAQPGKDRPTEFTGKSGSGFSLFVNKREKP